MQHTNQYNSNIFEDVHFWYPLVLSHIKKYSHQNSFHAQDDIVFRIQHIDINSYKGLIENSQLIYEFECLFKGFTLVYLWDDTEITPETFQIYAINVLAKEASRNFVYDVKIIHSKINKNQRKSIYLKLIMYSYQ